MFQLSRVHYKGLGLRIWFRVLKGYFKGSFTRSFKGSRRVFYSGSRRLRGFWGFRGLGFGLGFL